MARRTSNLANACVAAFLVAIVVVAWGGSARAEDRATEQARQHYESGTKHYDLGHWDEAIEDFEKAYELRPDPSFLYNLAQTNRRKGDLKRALDLYKNFLRKVPKGPQRDEVEEKIAALQKQIDEAAAKPAAVPIEPAPSAPVPLAPGAFAVPANDASSPAAVLPPTPSAVPDQPTTPSSAVSMPASPPVDVGSDSRPGRNLRIAGIVSGSVGAAAILTGAFFSLRVRSLSNKVEDASKFNPSDESTGQRAETLQWVCYGAGAAAAVAGGVLYYLGLRSAQPASSAVSLGPVAGPGTAGLSAMGVF